jgi:hypothetical protein
MFQFFCITQEVKGKPIKRAVTSLFTVNFGDGV